MAFFVFFPASIGAGVIACDIFHGTQREGLLCKMGALFEVTAFIEFLGECQ